MSEPKGFSELLLAEAWRLADLNVNIDAEQVPSVERHYRDRRGETMSDKQVEAERRRGDFFRDVLVAKYGCPPFDVHPMCVYATCPFMYDGVVDYSECWDDVAARAVGAMSDE